MSEMAHACTIALAGFDPTERIHLMGLWQKLDWETLHVESVSQGLLLLEKRTEVTPGHSRDHRIAMIARSSAFQHGLNPISTVGMLRSMDPRARLVLLTLSQAEARWYRSQDESFLKTAQEPVPHEDWDQLLELNAIRGLLEERPIPELFALCHTRRLTGRLWIRRGAVERQYDWRDGKITCAQSNILSETLGQYLKRCDALDESDLGRARELQMERGIRQGEALVSLGILNHSQLYHHLKGHVREKIINAFALPQGEYGFETLTEEELSGACFDYNIFALLVDGLQASQPRHRLADRWAQLSLMYLNPLVHKPESWRSACERIQHGSGQMFQETAWSSHPVQELFDTSLPMSERAAMVIALKLLGMVALEIFPVEDLEPVAWEEDDEPETPEALSPLDKNAEGEQILRTYLRFTVSNAFSVLGVADDATDREVREAYTGLKEEFSFAGFPGLSDILSSKLVEIHRMLERAFERIHNTETRERYHEALDAPQDSEKARPKRQRIALLEAEAAYLSGLADLEANRLEQALQQFQRAQRLNPSEPLFLLYEGWVLARHGRDALEQANGRSFLQLALSSNPMMAEGHFFLAWVAREEGRKDDASSALKRCLEIDPRHGAAQKALMSLSKRREHQQPSPNTLPTT